MFRKSAFRKIFGSKVMIWGIIAALFIPFVFFFHIGGGGPDTMTPDTAGRVFGRNIPWQEYQEQLTWVRLWAPEGIEQQDPALAQAYFEQEAWDRIMLAMAAKRDGISVSDREVADFIRSTPIFQENGQFVRSRYDRFLQLVRMAPRQFERLIRETRMIEILIDSIRESVHVTEADLYEAFLSERAAFAIAYVPFPVEPSESDRLAVPEEAVAEAYREGGFMTAPQVEFDYIAQTTAQLRNSISIDEDELSTTIERGDPDTPPSQENSQTTEQIKNDILEQKLITTMITLAIDIESDRQSGETLETIADRYGLAIQSEGPTDITSGERVSGLPQALFEAMQPVSEGGYTELVETDSGIYLARISRRIPPQPIPLESIRSQLVEKLAFEAVADRTRSAALDTLAQLTASVESGQSIQEAAQAAGVALFEPQPFKRDEPIDGLGRQPQINQALTHLKPGSFAELLATPRSYILVFLKERLEPSEEEFEAAKEMLVRQVERKKQEETFIRRLTDLRDQAAIRSHLRPVTEDALF